MKIIKTTFLLWIALLLSCDTFSKEITGTVTDSNTGNTIAGVSVQVTNKKAISTTDNQGFYKIEANKGDTLEFKYQGYVTELFVVSDKNVINIKLNQGNMVLEEVLVSDASTRKAGVVGSVPRLMLKGSRNNKNILYRPQYNSNTESYADIKENKFMNPLKDPLSTFAVDVDAASYSNVRRFINSGTIPPQDAVRIEEMINYFQYDVKAPTNGDPVKIYTELAKSPWSKNHQLLRISLKAKDIPSENLPASNFVFLIDVSGSMNGPNRLPLVQSSMKLLIDQLRPQDKVAIVTYAGSAEVKLESTAASNKMLIKQKIDELTSGGSTAGGAGITMAYQIARKNFIQSGNNRIVMATDGDFNVGESSDQAMEDLITRERKSGVSLTILGYGMGNVKDSKMELLANKGHGNYAYIDNISEARKAMVTEFGGTLFTVAKDVKIQVEFNPAYVKSYRLVGYENRLMEAEDFNNDNKLGGDMGVGHAVTAIYEIVPTGVESNMAGSVDPLKYQKESQKANAIQNGELATVKFRYKDPDDSKSKLQQVAVSNQAKDLNVLSEDFRFASAVAEYGMIIRDSEFKQDANLPSVIQRAKAAKGKDDEGYRAEFIRMVENTKSLMDTKGYASN